MTTETTTNDQQLPVLDLTVAEKAKQMFPVISDKANRGVLALSKITKIETDEEDAIANNLLVKVRVTIEGSKDPEGNKIPGIEAMRKEVTGKLDELKSLLILPENRLKAEAERVKGLRNKYANEKEARRQEEAKKVAEEQARKDAMVKVKAEIKDKLTDLIVEKTKALGQTISAHVSAMNLDNWDEMEKKFNLSPKLAVDSWAKCFDQPRNPLISEAVFAALIEEAKAEEPYEKHNSLYIQYAQPVVDQWKQDLPERKAKLIEIKELEERDAMKAAIKKRQMAEEAEKKQKEEAERLQKQEEERKEEQEREKNEQLLKNEFESHVITQQAAPQKNIRKKRVAIIKCEDSRIVQVWAKILFACYSNPKFKGHLKRTKEGLPIFDENQVPEYEAWAQKLLDFVAAETSTDIEGVEFKEIISTVSKA